MKKTELIKRYFLFILCLFFIGLGIALAKHSALGISPISSVANVLSLKWEFLTLGNWLTVMNCVFILLQILVLRKNFKIVQLLQLPLSFVFGWFTDFGLLLVQRLPNDLYLFKLLILLGGAAVLGFGIALGVIANVMLNSPEAFVKAVSDTTKKEFGFLKIALDVAMVVIAIAFSLVFFGRIEGIREGTVITALLVGLFVKFFRGCLQKPLEVFLKK
ncbi:MAG: YitT family protein [Clostridia bacterium]|nr:YitT family protein [Clostridia bacterium]